MSLFRFAVCAGCVLAALPADEAGQDRLLGLPNSAAAPTHSFCERNPHTCAATGELWDGLTRKVAFIARAASYAASTAGPGGAAPRHQPAITPQRSPSYSSFEPRGGRGSLIGSDLEPEWRAPGRNN